MAEGDKMQATLESEVEQMFEKYNIAEEQQDSIMVYLNLLRNKDIPPVTK